MFAPVFWTGLLPNMQASAAVIWNDLEAEKETEGDGESGMGEERRERDKTNKQTNKQTDKVRNTTKTKVIQTFVSILETSRLRLETEREFRREMIRKRLHKERV